MIYSGMRATLQSFSLGSVLQKYGMSYDLEAVQLCSVILN